MENKTFGATLAELRKAKGWTQLDLADSLGVTDKAVSKWERDIALPEVENLIKISDIFGVSLDSLLRGEEFSERKAVPEFRYPEPVSSAEAPFPPRKIVGTILQIAPDDKMTHGGKRLTVTLHTADYRVGGGDGASLSHHRRFLVAGKIDSDRKLIGGSLQDRFSVDLERPASRLQSADFENLPRKLTGKRQHIRHALRCRLHRKRQRLFRHLETNPGFLTPKSA